MSMESQVADVRTALVKTKFFSLHPKPLERWLWKQGIPQAAERVFWLHWEEGMRTGDWCSEIPLRRVARDCAIDTSTVTRAYQLLKSKGLLKREDPGRDVDKPFCQPIAITEVLLPRAFLTELLGAPNRVNRPPREATPMRAAQAPTLDPNSEPATSAPRQRLSRDASRAMWQRASEGERNRFYAASRDRLTAFVFDDDTQLTPEDRGEILALLTQLAAAKPGSQHQPEAARAGNTAYAGRRRLSLAEVARVRRLILNIVPSALSDEVLRQVVWAVEEGALRRFSETMALNIALKKIREGAWSKPNRMPPQWVLRAACASARPEQCSAA